MTGIDGERRLTPSFRPAQVPKRAPCQEGCPNSGDIRAWIGVIAQHHALGISREEAFARAWGIVTDVNPFPAVLGRVCPHPCQDGCNRPAVDESVAINALERFLGDWAVEQGLPLRRLADSGAHPESVGVVGAGPSGLSFAYQMARRGYGVTVYEARERAGGMLRYGIPDYRLPQDVLEAEIDRILALGVELRLGCSVGHEVTLEELRARHRVLYLGIGAQRGRALNLPGAELGTVLLGTDYLDGVARGERLDLGEEVVVVGGGNTAVDAARTARRAGARVVIVYRRSREEMPALAEEVEDALEEGVAIDFLAAPLRMETGSGGRPRLVAQRMRLGEPDASGRRRPIPLDGAEYDMPADTVIAAISQEPAWEGLEEVAPESGWFVTVDGGALSPGLWAGGDVLGLGIAGEAIAHGRRAAEAVHRSLRGLPEPPPDPRPSIDPADLVLDYHPPGEAVVRPRVPAEDRLTFPGPEVTQGITEEEAVSEAARCMSCGSCFGCEQCWMFCTPGCFTRIEEPEPGVYFTLSLDQCEECGKCIDVCPCGYLEMA